MEDLFKKHLPLVHSLVRRYQGGYADSEDLFQVGSIGLLKAIRNYDKTRGTAFSTYAVPVISGEIRSYLREQGTIKYSRSLKNQALRIKRLQEELGKRLGRPPTLNELEQAGGLDREEILMALDVLRTPLSLDAAEPGETVKPAAVPSQDEEVLDRVALREALAGLPARERQVIICRFFQRRTQQETAEMLGISQVHVSRLEKKILEDLRKALAV